MDLHDPYARHWREVRNRYYLVLVAFVGFIPTGVLAEAIEARVWPGHKTIENLAVIAYLSSVAILLARAKRVTCPRCGKPFTSKGLWHNDFAGRCLHCGLPRGATLAQVEAGTCVVPEFSWARVLRLVLAGLEVLLALAWLGLCVKVGSPLPRASGLLWLSGGIATLFAGTALMFPARWHWWLQLIPIGWLFFAYFGTK